MRKGLFLLLLLPVFSFCQNTLHVSVEGVKTSNGNISVAVYDQEDGFLKFDKVFKSKSATAEKGKTTVIINDLPEGTYALAAFHDENTNDELDTNFIGIPKEPLGFSKGKMKTFGPPSFDECSFKLTSDHSISVPIK